MTRSIMMLVAVAGIGASPTAMSAQVAMPQAQCPAGKADLPVALRGWADSAPVDAAISAGGVKAELTIGKRADATLHSTASIRYAITPEKPGALGTFGGLLAFDVAEAGSYRVSLGAPAWIDVVRGASAVASTAHAHGPECSGIRKMVDFTLTPGSYVLQIAGSGQAVAPVMVSRLP